MEQYKEINGIGYTLVGNYYLPNLLPPQLKDRLVGVWAADGWSTCRTTTTHSSWS